MYIVIQRRKTHTQQISTNNHKNNRTRQKVFVHKNKASLQLRRFIQNAKGPMKIDKCYW